MAKEKKEGPKKNLSAYMFYVQEARPRLVRDNPAMKFGEIGKRMGEEWKNLSEKEREPFIKKAAADKARYEREKAASA